MNDVLEKLPITAEAERRSRHFHRIPSGWGRLSEIEGRIFTERRLWLCGSTLVAAYIVAILLAWGLNRGDWIFRADGSPSNIDFCWIWVTGNFAVSEDPARIYDHHALSAAHEIFFRPGECRFLFFDYPPSFLFLTYPLGLLSYFSAFAVWIIATFVVYEAAVYAIISRPVALIAAAVPGPVLKNIQLGHNAFLTAGLIGLSLATMERRPWLSGVFIGLLTYKPQFGVLIPFALLASRNWRALISATVTTAVIGAAAAIAFGYETWPSFFDSLVARDAGLSPDAEVELKLQSLYGLLHWAGAGAWSAWSLHLAVAVIVAAAVCAVWAGPIPYALKAAILCVGSVAVTPYLLAYDLCILSIAVAFLVKDGMSRGFLAGERIAILCCFAGLFIVAAPIAPIVCAVLFCLVAWRILVCRRGLHTTKRHKPVGSGAAGS